MQEMLRTAGAPAWQQESLVTAWLQSSSQGDAEKAEVLLGEQSRISKGIRKALLDPVLVPALPKGGEQTAEHSEEETRG